VSVTEYVDDDAGYEYWTHTHPRGFVLNTNRKPSASYLMLHRADCSTMTGAPTRGSHWTADYRKVCAESVAELERWAREVAGAAPQRCSRCSP
jgi:hypothetical protein